MNNFLPNSNNCKIAIIGLGYVGLPLAIEFSKAEVDIKTNEKLSRHIIGFDISDTRIIELNRGEDRTKEITKDSLIKEINSPEKRLIITRDENLLLDADLYIITVPTPVNKAKKPNLQALESACNIVGGILKKRFEIKRNLDSYKIPIIVFESTVFPGATEEICVPIIVEKSGLEFNTLKINSFGCGYSPERINPGDKKHNLTSIVKITSGSNKEVAFFVNKVYSSIIKAGTFLVENIKIAEAAKVIENTQRDLNIALINELSIIFSKLKIDTLDVLEAAKTKWNFIPFEPGLVGGHCIGVDPYYLTYKSELLGYTPQVVLAGRKINDEMSNFIVNKTIQEFLSNGNKDLTGDCLLMGLTFKENCPDIRNTKVMDIYKSLVDLGFKVDVYDPWADKKEVFKQFQIELLDELPKEKKYLFIFVAVSHRQFLEISKKHWQRLILQNGLIIDIKGILPRELDPLRL